MKKLIFLFALVLFSVVLFAQDSLGIEVPEDVWEVLGDPNKWLGSLVLMAGVTVFLSQTVIRLWGAECGSCQCCQYWFSCRRNLADDRTNWSGYWFGCKWNI